MITQSQKGQAFAALHAREAAFIIPNPWDAGSARMLAALGFEALATTSAGFAFSVGYRDGVMSREATLANASAIAAASELPVSADLGDGFGETLEEIVATFRAAADTGIVGGSIEDMAAGGTTPYDLARAAERVRAAAEAVHALPFRFTLTARAENYLAGRNDLADTIARLQAYQEAGADVLYAPGLKSQGEIEAVVKSVDRPVNVLAGLPGMNFTLADLSALGVKRVSVGGAVARAAYTSAISAAQEMRDHGTFGFARDAKSGRDITALLEKK